MLLAFTLYFRRLKEPIEVKLILVFWGWVLISRLLNGDVLLATDIYMVIDTGLIYVFLVACFELKGKARERFLDWISIITTVFYTLVACMRCSFVRSFITPLPVRRCAALLKFSVSLYSQ